jgi:type III pantothenate kinase
VPLRVARTEANGSGVVNGYAEPAQMGVDRWLAMVAAWARHGSAVCIADAGTALTVDLVGADGRHAGGLILPGLALMRRALLDQTGGIAVSADMKSAHDSEAGALGRDTASCIREAARRASACVVESCVKALPGMAVPRLVVTGGDAAALIAALGGRAEHRPCLVLEGLALRLCGVLPEPEILH